MTADSRSRIQVRRLCCQNLMEIMKLLIDFGRIGNRARHFRCQRFAIVPGVYAKAKCAESQSELQVFWPLLADLAASFHHRLQMVV